LKSGDKMVKNIPREVLYVMQQFNINNHQAYLVGGCVRDMLLNKQPKDFDICTSAYPHEVKLLFEHVILTGEKHGTVTVIINHYPIEVTTMRNDGAYKDNRHPEYVDFTDNLFEDLSRRDFTINAIAVDINNNMYDYYHGQDDLYSGIIKAVGDVNLRFNEDALRMMRCIRFACQLDFKIENQTIEAITNNRYLLLNVAIERIREELNKILISNKPSYGIRMLYKVGLLELILPELYKCIGFDQYNPHHNKNVFDHIMSVLDNIPDDLILRLSALLHDVGKPQTFTIDEQGKGHFYSHHMRGADITEEILQRMKYDNRTIDTVKLLVKEHMSRYDFLRNASIKKFINRIGIDNLEYLFELQIADIKGSKEPHNFDNILKLKELVQEVLNKKEPLTVKDLNINGNDLIKLGIKPSKEMGNILNKLLETVLENPELNNKVVLLELVKNLQLQMPI